MNPKSLFYSCLPLFLLLSTVSAASGFDQDFYKKNLKTTSYSIDTEANAVVLYESNDIELQNAGIFVTEIQSIHRIIKIINPEYSGIADVHIYCPDDDSYQFGIANVKGDTYNLSGETISKTSITDKDIYRKKKEDGLYSASFSLPDVKKGSIIEYSYKITSRVAPSVFSWDIQSEFPKLLTAYSITYPGNYEFTTIALIPMAAKEYASETKAEESADSFCIVKKAFDGQQKCFWLRRNVTGVQEENYTFNLQNHLEKLELQITGFSFGSEKTTRRFNNTWDKINDEFWGQTRLKTHISSGTGFLNETIDSLVSPEWPAYEKADTIFKYVRSEFKLVPNDNTLFKLDLRYVFKYKEGSREEINLLLTAMLLRAGIEAAPLIISTTGHPASTKDFPVMSRMTYMACIATIDSGYVVMDASDKNNCFGMLPIYCYNGYAWILGDPGKGITLTPQIIKDKNAYGIKISDFTDSTAKMEITEKYGMFRSVAYRKEWAQHHDKAQKDIDELKRGLPENVEITDSHIENENDPDANLIVKFNCILNFDKGTNNFFMNASMIRFFNKNPFEARVRKLPIEFPYKTELAYNMNIILPPHLAPDSVAAPMEQTYGNGAMRYKKITGYFPEMHTFTISTSLLINTTSFSKDQYSGIRAFFQKVVDEDNKTIVFKKTGN